MAPCVDTSCFLTYLTRYPLRCENAIIERNSTEFRASVCKSPLLYSTATKGKQSTQAAVRDAETLSFSHQS